MDGLALVDLVHTRLYPVQSVHLDSDLHTRMNSSIAERFIGIAFVTLAASFIAISSFYASTSKLNWMLNECVCFMNAGFGMAIGNGSAP